MSTLGRSPWGEEGESGCGRGGLLSTRKARPFGPLCHWEYSDRCLDALNSLYERDSLGYGRLLELIDRSESATGVEPLGPFEDLAVPIAFAPPEIRSETRHGWAASKWTATACSSVLRNSCGSIACTSDSPRGTRIWSSGWAHGPRILPGG